MRADGLHEEKPARRACLAASAALFGRDKRAGARRMRGGSGGGRRAGRRKGRRLPCAARTPEGCRFAGIKRKKRGEAASFPLAARPEPIPALLRVPKRLAPKPWQPGSRKRSPCRWGRRPSRPPPMASIPVNKKTASSKQKEAALLFAGVLLLRRWIETGEKPGGNAACSGLGRAHEQHHWPAHFVAHAGLRKQRFWRLRFQDGFQAKSLR